MQFRQVGHNRALRWHLDLLQHTPPRHPTSRNRTMPGFVLAAPFAPRRSSHPHNSAASPRVRVTVATLSPPPAARPTPPQGLPPPRPNVVTDLRDIASLLTLVASTSGLLVIEAYSRSCRACIGMRRTYERVASDYPNARFARVCVDDVSEVRESLDVRSMPLFVFYNDGQRIDHYSGASRSSLEEAISDNL